MKRFLKVIAAMLSRKTLAELFFSIKSGNKNVALLYGLGILVLFLITIWIGFETKKSLAPFKIRQASARESQSSSDEVESLLIPGSEIDIKILAALKERKERLGEQEESLKVEEERLSMLKQDIEDKLKKLKNIEKNIEKMIKVKDESDLAKLKHLVKVYESMRPEEAAPLIEKMDQQIVVKLLSKMKGKIAGKILASVDPSQAVRISEKLLKYNK